MGKVRVFISSSMEELEPEREIAENAIAELHLEPVIFEGLPAMNKSLEDAYLDEVKGSHILVILLWKDLTTAVQNEYNTALEHGIPSLIFVKMLASGENRTARLEKFLEGTTRFSESSSVPFHKKFRTLYELKEELKEGLMKLVSDRFTEPAVTTSNIEVNAKMALNMVQTAKRTLLLVVRTPIILFEPRPYHSKHKQYMEDKFYKALEIWIERVKEDESRKCLYLYSHEDTLREMRKHKLEQLVKRNLERFKQIEEETHARFELSSIPEFPGKILISDNSFGIQFRAPKDNVICVFRQDASVATNLFEIMYQYRGEKIKSTIDLLKELGLT